jgi:hypothetical protein
MRNQDLILLLLLSAIWGASFLFLRVAAFSYGIATNFIKHRLAGVPA